MAVPFSPLIAARSRVLPQGGAVLGQLSQGFGTGFEQGRQQAAQDAAPGLIMDYLDAAGAGYQQQPALGTLTQPVRGATGSGPAPATTQARTSGLTPVPDGQSFAGGQRGGGAFGLASGALTPVGQPTPSPDYATNIAAYGSGLNTTGLDPAFGSGLDAAIQAYIAAGGDPSTTQINSLVRSTEEQQRLYDQYQRGEIGLAAPPGSSRHEYGAAADIQSGPFLDWLTQNANQYGLSFLQGDAYAADPGHVQLAGASPAGTRAPAIPAGAGSMASPAGGGTSGGWSPPVGQERAALRALIVNPATREMGIQLAMERMMPPAPTTPNWQLQTVNGTVYRVDPASGRAEPVIRGQPSAADRPTREDQNGVLRYLDTGDPVFPGVVAAPDPAEPPETRNILMPDGNVYIMGFNPQTGQFDQRIGLADPGGQFSVAVGADGGVQVTQGRGASPATATEGQANANIYATRMEAASPIIDQFTASGQNFWSGLVSGAGIVGNIVLSQIDPEYQQFAQATRDFINASLRRESGAVISEEEFANARAQYIPQPGDTAATLEQKRQNRIRQMQAIRQASGPFATQGAAPDGAADPAAAGADYPRLPTDDNAAAAVFNALPSGALFYDPEGNLRRKP